MQPITINVNVQLGVSSELTALLTPLLAGLQAGSQTLQPAEVKETKKPRAAKQPKAEVENQPAALEEVAQETAPEPQPETLAEAPTETETEKEYTEVDVRAAMDATRKRIEGENYKEQTDSEGYKRWHRVLTAWFKNVAATLGSDKPSTLPDSESRGRFIRACEAVYVKNDELTEDCPF